LLPTNPLATKKAPRAEQEPVQILQPGEIAILLNAFKDHPLGCFVLLALTSGARRSELLALRWMDVNLDAATIRIERSLEETRSQGLRFKTPKTAAGRRSVGLPASVVAELRNHRKKQLELRLRLGQGRQPDDALVFSLWNGEPRTPGSVTRAFDVVRKRAGLAHIRLHALRHTHVSALIVAGVPVTEIARRLGHSSPVVTLRIYAGLFGSQDDASVAAVDKMLIGANPVPLGGA
jgi:integrase